MTVDGLLPRLKSVRQWGDSRWFAKCSAHPAERKKEPA